MQDFHPRSHPSRVLKPGIICTFLIHSCSLQKMLTALFNLVWNTQKSKWTIFLKIMISIPPNTIWIKSAYSYLELIYAKQRNKMSISALANLLFLSVLKRPVRDLPDCEKEIKRMHCGY